MKNALPMLRDHMLELLHAEGIAAMEAYPMQARRLVCEPLVLVSVKELKAETSGFLDYLGMRFDAGGQSFEEIYGQTLSIGFSLDLYSPKKDGEAGAQELVDRISELLARQSPGGLSFCELSWGELCYDKSCDLFRRGGTLRCKGMLYRRQDEEGNFLSFEVRGGLTLG